MHARRHRLDGRLRHGRVLLRRARVDRGGRSLVDQGYEVFIVTPGGGRRHIAVLRSERRADRMRETLAGEHGVPVEQIEVRPAKQSRWGGRDTREALWDTRRVEDGEYRLRAVTTDVTGRSAAGPEIGVTVDNTGPTVHVDAPGHGAVLMGVVEVSANARDAGSGLALVRFECSEGGDAWSEVGTVTEAPYRVGWNTGVLGEGDYRLRAIALDRAGTRRSRSRSRSVSSAFLPRSSSRIPASGSRGRCGCRRSSAPRPRPWASSSRSPPPTRLPGRRLERLAASVRARGRYRAARGRHVRPARGRRDKASGIDASRIVRARRIDNVAPSVTVYEPAAGALLRGEVPLSARAADHGSGITSVLFQFSRDGQTWRPVVTRGESAGAVYWDTARVEDGEYALRAVVADVAGNLTASDQVSVRIDNTPPSVAIDEPQPGSHLAGIVRLQASSADDGSGVIAVRFEWSRDASAWGELATTTAPPYGYPWDTTRVADGTCYVRAVARDRVGNSAFGQPVELAVRNTLVFAGPAPPPEAEPATDARPSPRRSRRRSR